MKFPKEVEEKRIIRRISISNTFADFLNAFNVERGLIFTVKNLLWRPGFLIRYYMGEGRFKVTNAFRLLILSTAVSLIALYLFDFQDVVAGISEGFNNGEQDAAAATDRIWSLYNDYYNLFLWISIPCYALTTFLFFRKRGYNYAEHLVLQSFYLSGVNIIYIIIAPFYLLGSYEWVTVGAMLVSVFYYMFVCVSFFESKSFKGLVKVLFSFFLSSILYFVLLGTIVNVLIILTDAG